MAIQQFKHFKGVYEGSLAKRSTLFTKNLVLGVNVYGESIVKDGGVEYREWDVTRSKLGAALRKEISQIGIKEGDYVLYLGASTGTTVSHVSDMVGERGMVFALDIAPRVLRDMVFVAEQRKNIAPILADANHPESFAHLISEVDVVFMDIAQKNQTEIFVKNCKAFLKSGGFGLLALKARSVDVTKRPRDIYKIVREELEKKIVVVDYRELDPYEKDHAFYVCKKR